MANETLLWGIEGTVPPNYHRVYQPTAGAGKPRTQTVKCTSRLYIRLLEMLNFDTAVNGAERCDLLLVAIGETFFGAEQTHRVREAD